LRNANSLQIHLHLISGIGIAYPVFLAQAFLAKNIGQEVVQYQEQS